MRKMVLLPVIFILASAAASSAARPAEGASPQDEEALRKVHEQFASAWNQHDATAMSVLWAEDGDWIGPDGYFVDGRARVENYLAEAHTGDWATSKIAVKVRSIRFLKADVAVVTADQEITGARDFFDNPIPTQKVVATSVVVSKDGKWLIAAYRAFIPPPPPSE